jgi:hypothetical protein
MKNSSFCVERRVLRSYASLFLPRFPAILLAATALVVSVPAALAVPPSQYGFYTVTPCRVVDTRNAAGPYGGPAVAANSTRTFVFWGRCGIPSGATAISLNVTATGATANGNFRIYPGGTSLPLSSTLNYKAGRDRANNGSYKLGGSGDLAVRSDQTSGSAHLIIDVAGYYQSPGSTPPPPPPPSGSPFTKWYRATGDERGRAVVVDDGGSVLVSGQYQGTLDFGSGSITSFTNPTSGPTTDAFVAKYSASGAAVWSRGFGGNASDSAGGLSVDSLGNVAVTGYQASSTVDYGAGPLTNRGVTDIFIAKFSGATGGHQWSKTVGGTGADGGTAAAQDGSGSVFVTGYMSAGSGVDFGGGALTSAGGQDVFLVKYSSTGAHVWSKRFGSSGHDQGIGVAVDGAGSVSVMGISEGTIDFGGGPLTSLGGRDLFVAKFSATGQHLWSERFGSTGTDNGRGIAVDGAGDVFLTGDFVNSISFGGPALTSSGREDVFLAKLSGVNGGHLWSKRFGNLYSGEMGLGVAVDGGNNVAITGFFGEDINFGGGPIYAQLYDIFVAKFNSAGAHLSSRRYGDPPAVYDNQHGNAIAISSGGNMFITGNFLGTLDFGAGGQSTSTPYGGNDAYLAHLGQ